MAELAGMFFKRLTSILDEEGVTYEGKAVADLIMKHAPDWRRVLNEAQRFSISGSNITTLDKSSTIGFDDLTQHLKSKDFKKMRRWVVDHTDLDPVAIFRGLYDNMNTYVVSGSIPQLVLILADYQYKNAFVADHELNTVACLTEIMANVEFN
jgi:hypothetical protein